MMFQTQLGCGRGAVSGLLVCLLWPFVSASSVSDSLLFEAETLQVAESSEVQCIQVGLYLTYRGSGTRAWSVLNMTLSYDERQQMLSRPPFVRLSDFSGPSLALSETPNNLPDHSGDGLQGKWKTIINSSVLGREPELSFVEGTSSVAAVTESVNPATSRIELQAVGRPVLFETRPNERVLVAVVSIPVASARSGRLRISFLPDGIVKDGNSLIGPDGKILSALLLNGSLEVARPPIGSEELALAVVILALLGGAASILLTRRAPQKRWFRRRRAGAFLVAGAAALGIFLYMGRGDLESDAGNDLEASDPGAGPVYGPATAYQFVAGRIQVPGAYRFERRIGHFDLSAATSYLEKGLDAWEERYRCVGCHTSGIYFLVRPMLTSLGPPSASSREFEVAELAKLEDVDLEVALKAGQRTAQVVYLSAGLSSWDHYVGRTCSPEAERALGLLFRLQDADGGWTLPQCWPPLQSSRLQLASVAALAVGLASASGLDVGSSRRKEGIDRLTAFLRSAPRTLDYDRVWLLWADSVFGGVLEPGERREISRMILDRQHSDGGWSLREFGSADSWADGLRRARLVSEPEFYMPVSDGHMTGLAVIALEESGVAVEHRSIQLARRWIEKNQRASGRWWTSSLNTENLHLIAYSGTCFCLLALSRTGGVLRPEP